MHAALCSVSTVLALGYTPSVLHPQRAGAAIVPRIGTPKLVVGEQANSKGPAAVLRQLKKELPQFPWLAEGAGNPANKVDMPDFVRSTLANPHAPQREAESHERTERIRGRFEEATKDAAALKNMLVGEADATAWWRTPRNTPVGGRSVTTAPL